MQVSHCSIYRASGFDLTSRLFVILVDQVCGFDLIPILEDQELNKKMMKFGRARLANAVCTTSDRRIKLYGVFLITLLHLFIGVGVSAQNIYLQSLSHKL